MSKGTRAEGKKHRPDNLKPGTEQFYKRQLRHRHNGFSGTVAMAKAGMNAIIQASTTTDKTKWLAGEALSLLRELGEELKTRVD
jgi:hypothetical protein